MGYRLVGTVGCKCAGAAGARSAGAVASGASLATGKGVTAAFNTKFTQDNEKYSRRTGQQYIMCAVSKRYNFSISPSVADISLPADMRPSDSTEGLRCMDIDMNPMPCVSEDTVGLRWAISLLAGDGVTGPSEIVCRVDTSADTEDADGRAGPGPDCAGVDGVARDTLCAGSEGGSKEPVNSPVGRTRVGSSSAGADAVARSS
jgi:hypothetical protein